MPPRAIYLLGVLSTAVLLYLPLFLGMFKLPLVPDELQEIAVLAVSPLFRSHLRSWLPLACPTRRPDTERTVTDGFDCLGGSALCSRHSGVSRVGIRA